MSCGPQGRAAQRGNILAGAGRFLLENAEAEAIFTRITDTVRAEWHAAMRRAGVTDQDCAAISGAFLYDGLFQDGARPIFEDKIPAPFLQYAADILADTAHGLSGANLLRVTAAHAAEHDVRLRHPTYPFEAANKRAAGSVRGKGRTRLQEPCAKVHENRSKSIFCVVAERLDRTSGPSPPVRYRSDRAAKRQAGLS